MPIFLDVPIALVKQLAADGRTMAGSDCSGCPFIAGCDRFPDDAR